MKNSSLRFLRHNALALVGGGLLLGVSTLPMHAASHTWAGAGISGYWSLPANWAGNNPPVAGETAPVTIIFPPGLSRLTNTNNVGGLIVNQIVFTGNGYTLCGSGAGINLTLQGGRGAIVITNAANQPNFMDGSLNLTLLSSCGFAIGPGGSLVVDGVIQGAGTLGKSGDGIMTFYGDYANTYSGGTYVTAGTLKVYCGTSANPQVATPGYLEIGGGTTNATVQLLGNSQLSTTATVQIDNWGLLDLNNNSATCGPLILNLGTAQTGSGTLTLNGDVSGAGGYILDHLSLGGVTRHFSTSDSDLYVTATIVNGGPAAGIIKDGNGLMELISANSFSGPVTINAGSIGVKNSNSLGTGAGGVTVNNGGALVLESSTSAGLTINNVSLTLNGGGDGDGALTSFGTNTWAGPINLASDSVVGGSQFTMNDQLTLSGPISGAGNLQVGSTNYISGTGTVIFSGSADNTFGGALSVVGTNVLYLNKTSGATAVPGAFNIGTDKDTYNSTKVGLEAANQIANSAVVTILTSGWLNLDNFNETLGTLNFDGGTETGAAGMLTLAGNVSCTGYGGQILSVLSLGGQTRTFDLQGQLYIGGTISDGGASSGINLTNAAGYGVLTLDQSNSFSGPVIVSGNAQLQLYDDPNVLGPAGQGVLLTNQGSLFIQNVQIAGKPLILAGSSYVWDTVYGTVTFSDTNLWSGPVILATPALMESWRFGSGAQLTLSGPISGPGSLAFDGTGSVKLSGGADNTYGGSTTLNAGLLYLQKTGGHLAIPAGLVIGNATDPVDNAIVEWMGSNQVFPGPASPVQVNNSGYLYLNNHSQTVPQLFLADNAFVDSGSGGLLTLAGNITVDASLAATAYINGNLSLGGASRIITFDANPVLFTATLLNINAKISDGGGAAGITARHGVLTLTASNSFTGTLLADNNYLNVDNSFALGTTNSAVILTNASTLTLNSSVTNKSLTAAGSAACYFTSNGTNTWAGPVQLLGDMVPYETVGDALILNGPVTGTANLLPSGMGRLQLAGSSGNTFTGTTISSIATLELAKTNDVNALTGPLQIAANSMVRDFGTGQIHDTDSVTINTGGTFDLNNFSEYVGDFSGAGSLQLGSGFIFVSGINATNTFSGTISGTDGRFEQAGTNTMILTGTNTYTGFTLVSGGTLLINGAQSTNCPVFVEPGTMLGGNGSIGPLNCNGSTISPGNGPGRLTINGNIILDGNTTVRIELNGTSPGVSYDQLDDFGQLAANQATLQVMMGFSGAVSNQYTIVSHPTGFTATIFNNLPEGGIVTANNGATFQISYFGGAGNDTVLTQLTLATQPHFSGITRLGNGGIQLNALGGANLTYTVQATTNLAAANWLPIGTATANGAGGLFYTDAQSTNFPARFYRITYP